MAKLICFLACQIRNIQKVSVVIETLFRRMAVLFHLGQVFGFHLEFVMVCVRFELYEPLDASMRFVATSCISCVASDDYVLVKHPNSQSGHGSSSSSYGKAFGTSLNLRCLILSDRSG